MFSFQALFGQALDVRKIEMRKTMICEEVEIENSWENVKKHAQKRRQILNKSSLNHSKSTPMGSKIDSGASKTSFWTVVMFQTPQTGLLPNVLVPGW